MATQTETKANGKGDELAAVSRAVGLGPRRAARPPAATWASTRSPVEQFADLEVNSAEAVRLPLVVTITETHAAAVTRQLAGAYVKAARDLLPRGGGRVAAASAVTPAVRLDAVVALVA